MSRLWLLAAVLAALLAGGCRAGSDDDEPMASAGGSGGVPAGVDRCDPCDDLAGPIIFDEGTDESVLRRFADAAPGGGGVCITDPAPGSLFPRNWVRPRLRWLGEPGAVYEVRISHPRQREDLVIYTTAQEYYLPRDVWSGSGDSVAQRGLARNAGSEPVRVLVTAVLADGTRATGESDFTVAPVGAGGSLVYWSANDIFPGLDARGEGTSWLSGFRVGDEASARALELTEVEAKTLGQSGSAKPAEAGIGEGRARCVGCHASTPDGEAVVFSDHWPWNMLVASVAEGSVGEQPSWLSPAAELALNLPWQGMATMATGAWGDDGRLVITTLGRFDEERPEGPWGAFPETPSGGNNTALSDLAWVDLSAEAPGLTVTVDDAVNAETRWAAVEGLRGRVWGVLPRSGDPRAAVAPDLSEDASVVVYTSTDAQLDGHLGEATEADIYQLSLDVGPLAQNEAPLPGPASAVPGASDPGVFEYYPDISRCGVADAGCPRLLAFNRVLGPTGAGVYARGDGEIWVAPLMTGATPAADEVVSASGAVRLEANDPAECQIFREPPGTLLNSWARWAPVAEQGPDGTRYYWVVFSSGRESPGDLPFGDFSPPDRRASQLYLTAVTVGPDDVLRTYPAIYLWNQEREDEDGNVVTNLTPAWDLFQIPEVPVPVVPQ